MNRRRVEEGESLDLLQHGVWVLQLQQGLPTPVAHRGDEREQEVWFGVGRAFGCEVVAPRALEIRPEGTTWHADVDPRECTPRLVTFVVHHHLVPESMRESVPTDGVE